MQLLIDGIGAKPDEWDERLVTKLSFDIAEAASMTIFYGPHLVKNGTLLMAMTLIAESHISFHLDRETGRAWADVFTCKEMPDGIAGLIIERLNLSDARLHRLERGDLPGGGVKSSESQTSPETALLVATNRSLAGRMAAFTMHSQHDTNVVSAPGRAAAAAALDRRLLQEIDERDPDLSEAERQRRLTYARKAHYTRLALASAKARQRKAAGK